MKNKVVLLGVAIIVLAIVAFFVYQKTDAETRFGMQNIKYNSDVIGTKAGTTTAGVYFSSVASSTYLVKSGGADAITFTMLAVNASTTQTSWVYITMLGSNDWDCMTSTTTRNTSDTTNEQVLVSEVNWYDIGQHVVELAGTQTIPSATSTLVWESHPGFSQEFTLDNLNYECLAVQISSSSTEMFMQARLK